MRGKWIVAAVLVVLLMGGGWFYFRPEARVRRQVARLERRCGKAREDGPIVLAARARSLEFLFAEECRVGIRVTRLNGVLKPADVSRLAMESWNNLAWLNVRFSEIRVNITGSDEARAHVLAEARGQAEGGEPVNEREGLVLSYRKMDGAWLLYGVSTDARGE